MLQTRTRRGAILLVHISLLAGAALPAPNAPGAPATSCGLPVLPPALTDRDASGHITCDPSSRQAPRDSVWASPTVPLHRLIDSTLRELETANLKHQKKYGGVDQYPLAAKRDVAALRVLQELVSREAVLSLGGLFNEPTPGEMRIRKLRQPLILPADEFQLQIPGIGAVRCTLAGRIVDEGIVHDYKPNKDLAYGKLVLEVVFGDPIEGTRLEIKSTDSYVLLIADHFRLDTVYLFQPDRKIIVPVPARPKKTPEEP
jgi:hypothetical protein